MNTIFKRIELLANVAIITVALLLGGVLIKRFVFTSQTPNQSSREQTNIGDRVTLANVDWSKNNSSLLLVLSEGCKYCTDSGAFYRRLAKVRAEQNAIRMIAVLPQTVGDGQKYLNSLDVSVDEVRQAPLNALGIRGTPTLLLVNNAGIVTDIWIGKLPPEKEDEVLNRLRL